MQEIDTEIHPENVRGKGFQPNNTLSFKKEGAKFYFLRGKGGAHNFRLLAIRMFCNYVSGNIFYLR